MICVVLRHFSEVKIFGTKRHVAGSSSWTASLAVEGCIHTESGIEAKTPVLPFICVRVVCLGCRDADRRECKNQNKNTVVCV